MLLLNEVLADSGGVLVADLLKNERIDVCFCLDIAKRYVWRPLNFDF